MGLATALINGSHGMTFAPKLGVIGALILVDLSIITICGLLETFIPSQAGIWIGVGWGVGLGLVSGQDPG